LFYDANGNVGQYLDGSGNIVAAYQYSPFGVIISKSGTKQDDFNFRFSTKFLDNTTGLYYYGFRYYSPRFAHWINRDPIGENGGINLYAMVGNDAVNWVDELGLYDSVESSFWVQIGLGNYQNAIQVAEYLCVTEARRKVLIRFAQAAIEAIAAKKVLDTVDDLVVPAKGGKQKVKDTGLQDLSDEEVSERARDKSRSGKERRRYQKEEKARKNRNKNKRRQSISPIIPTIDEIFPKKKSNEDEILEQIEMMKEYNKHKRRIILN
jgi:RHS repeat-associated protein